MAMVEGLTAPVTVLDPPSPPQPRRDPRRPIGFAKSDPAFGVRLLDVTVPRLPRRTATRVTPGTTIIGSTTVIVAVSSLPGSRRAFSSKPSAKAGGLVVAAA